tara:strand:- start:13 stop:231 length:219 start_codon:yes stop_codon:yes gene_type:complete
LGALPWAKPERHRKEAIAVESKALAGIMGMRNFMMRGDWIEKRQPSRVAEKEQARKRKPLLPYSTDKPMLWE